MLGIILDATGRRVHSSEVFDGKELGKGLVESVKKDLGLK